MVTVIDFNAQVEDIFNMTIRLTDKQTTHLILTKKIIQFVYEIYIIINNKTSICHESHLTFQRSYLFCQKSGRRELYKSLYSAFGTSNLIFMSIIFSI